MSLTILYSDRVDDLAADLKRRLLARRAAGADPRGEAVVAYPAALLPEHDLAYAVTVHKSQGSEYGSVLLVLPAAESCPLLTRQLLYTGVTRARRRAVLLAADAALDAALAREEARDTGVSL